MTVRVFVVTGEPSGDLHASKMVKGLLQDSNILVDACGSKNLRKVGANCFLNSDNLAVMGFKAVWLLPRLLIYLLHIIFYIKTKQPDLVILVDYPGFNLVVARVAKLLNCKVLYYIAPKVWASRPNRIKTIAKYVDHVAVIFPFEVDVFKSHVPTTYVGNPLLPMPKINKDKDLDELIKHKSPVIAFLPGSRKSEVKYMFPVMQQAANLISQNHAIAIFAKADSVNFNGPNTCSNALAVMQSADVVVVTAGTAALEAAMLQKPMVVCYKTSKFNAWCAKKILICKFISLPNIILNKPCVPELLQMDMTPENIIKNVNIQLKQGNPELNKVVQQLSRQPHVAIEKLILDLLQ